MMNIQYKKLIDFSGLLRIDRNIFSPNAMGYFSYLPFMECYHDIISMNHNLKGALTVDTKGYDFTGGKGYIEKDWEYYFQKNIYGFNQIILMKQM